MWSISDATICATIPTISFVLFAVVVVGGGGASAPGAVTYIQPSFRAGFHYEKYSYHSASPIYNTHSNENLHSTYIGLGFCRCRRCRSPIHRRAQQQHIFFTFQFSMCANIQ